LTYLQIALAVIEIFSAGAATWQLKGRRDPLWIPILIAVVGAGALVPSIYPIGHATILSLAIQVFAAVTFLGIAGIGLQRACTR